MSSAELAAALLLLDRLGIRPEQLIGIAGPMTVEAAPLVALPEMECR